MIKELPTINAFWIGSELGPIHAACLASFAKHGHRVVLHTYGPSPKDTPNCVKIADANLILNRKHITKHRKTGSFALAADLFRYELLTNNKGIYIDCDCYCVRPLEDNDYIFGLETDSRLCNAVLKLPADSHLLAAMRHIGYAKAFNPPWEKPLRRIFYSTRARIGLPVQLADMKWGTAGPVALTYYAEHLGEITKARPIDEFYPVHYQQISLLTDANLNLEDLITPRTKIIHLWHEYLRRHAANPAPGSPLAKILDTNNAY